MHVSCHAPRGNRTRAANAGGVFAGTPTWIDLPIKPRWKIAANLGTVLRFHWITVDASKPAVLDYPAPVDIKS